MRVEPFQVDIPEEALTDLKRRLLATNWPSDYANENWSYGTNGIYLRKLTDYWLNKYDWRAQEKVINSFHHYRTNIERIPIHFIHERGKGPRPIPIVLTHGWPWTFWDLHKVIRPLADPVSYGADEVDAFDVVVPSLPGFIFSTPLTTPGINFWRTADLWVTLMQEVLGYERFGAQGGDWGALVATQLGHKYASKIIGIHLTDALQLSLFSNDRPWEISGVLDYQDVDQTEVPELMARWLAGASHVAVHVIDPQTLAYGLHDSPVGLCAWILERLRAFSDCDGDVERRFSKDHLLTTVMLYWLTNSFVTSARFYYEAAANPWKPTYEGTPVVKCPTGVTLLRVNARLISRPWLEAYYNLTFVKEHPSGDHFAPFEEPEAVVKDIRETFRPLR